MTYATTGRDCDLYCVTPRLTHLLQVQGLVGSFVVSSFNTQRSCINTNLTKIKKTDHVKEEYQIAEFSFVIIEK